jgi:hypothetical protein
MAGEQDWASIVKSDFYGTIVRPGEKIMCRKLSLFLVEGIGAKESKKSVVLLYLLFLAVSCLRIFAVLIIFEIAD